LKEVRWCVVR